MDQDIFEQLRTLMSLARQFRLSEVNLEGADLVIRLRRGVPRRRQPQPRAGGSPAPAAEITSPLVGVFYRAPTPDAPPYVEVGDWVEPGQTVGLIEAMKVFNEIASEIEGRVAAITARSGELVQAGQVLMVVELVG